MPRLASAKRPLCLLAAFVLAMMLCTCADPSTGEEAKVAPDPTLSVKSEGVMTHQEFLDAEVGTEVTIEGYVQGRQGSADGITSLYVQDLDGGYFCYDIKGTSMLLSTLDEGRKVKISGKRYEWYSMPEIFECRVAPLDGSYVAEPIDVSDLMGTDELKDHLSEKVLIQTCIIEPCTSPSGEEVPYLMGYDGEGESDDDLIFKASKNGKTYTFVVESDLVHRTSAIYKAVRNLRIGDAVDIESFLYWYNGEPNPHAYDIFMR